jgi:membrane-associated phospholipid phosphatase
MNADPQLQRCSSVDALRNASLRLVVASIAAAALMVFAARVPVAPDGADILAWIVATALIVSMVLNSRRPRIADSFGALGQAWLGGLACCVIAVAGLGLRMPSRDAALLAIDRAIGVDGPAVLVWTLHQPHWFVQLLSTSYGATVGLVFLSFILLAVLGDRVEVWRAVMCFLGTVLTSCLIAVATPALGMSAWVSPELLKRLSAGTPRHLWPRFEHFHDFHDGTSAVLRLDSLASCVTFPSFHTIMGLIVAAMWRKRMATFVPAFAWLTLMVFSTLPFGGHYVVDLIGGVAVWGMWFALSHRVERSGWAQFPRPVSFGFASEGLSGLSRKLTDLGVFWRRNGDGHPL